MFSGSRLGGRPSSIFSGGLGGLSAPTINKDPVVEDNQLPKDWEVANTVGVNAALNTECDTCPSPSPTATPRSLSLTTKSGGLLPRVLGARIAQAPKPGINPSICIRGKVGPAESRYTPHVGNLTQKVPVNGSSAVDIMETICGNNGKSPVDCGALALGCSWWRIGGRGFTVRQNGLVDRKSTRLNSSHIPLSRMPSSA